MYMYTQCVPGLSPHTRKGLGMRLLLAMFLTLYVYMCNRVVQDPVNSNGSLNSGDEDDCDLFVNPNRPPPFDIESSSEESSSEVED